LRADDESLLLTNVCPGDADFLYVTPAEYCGNLLEPRRELGGTVVAGDAEIVGSLISKVLENAYFECISTHTIRVS
jgi:hypothetical protein